MNDLWTWLAGHEWNSPLAVLLYWMPLLMCSIGYFIRTYQNYQKDISARDLQTLYFPTDTVGSLIGRGLVTVLPIGNLLAAIFDVGPQLFRRFFGWIAKVFDQPLVPRRKSLPSDGGS